MAERFEIYKCELCGNVIEVLHGGAGALVCCGKPMIKQVEKTADQGKEKHVPVLEKTAKGYKVKVGSIPHPMEEKHFIEFVELMCANGVQRKFLKPGAPPEAEFETSETDVKAREFCTIHGLWKS